MAKNKTNPKKPPEKSNNIPPFNASENDKIGKVESKDRV